MPEYALANDLWLGRVPVDLRNGSLGLRMLLGLGRLCFRKQLLGKGEDGYSAVWIEGQPHFGLSGFSFTG